MSVFWNREERRLRVGWRLAVHAALMLVLGALPIVAIAEPLTALHRRGLFLPGLGHDAYDRVVNIIVGPFLTAGVIASCAIARRRLDHGTMAELGVRLDRRWWTGLALGFGVGAVVMGLVFAVEFACGWVTVTGTFAVNAGGASLGVALAFSAVKCLCVGHYEEFVSRGYHLGNTGVLVSSLIFAALHVFTDNASVASFLGVFVNALFFAAALRFTGRLSTAIGAHVAWNFVQGAVLGFPVSGDKEGASLIGIAQHGPAWMTGGAYGPEAGLLGVMASVGGILLLALATSRRFPVGRSERFAAVIDREKSRDDAPARPS
jgi:membrane protease YdiL (CAAX protease family)